jgi:hypothetical protein
MTALNWIRDRAAAEASYTLEVDGKTYVAESKVFAGYLPRGMARRIDFAAVQRGELVHEVVTVNIKTSRCEYRFTEYRAA